MTTIITLISLAICINIFYLMSIVTIYDKVRIIV